MGDIETVKNPNNPWYKKWWGILIILPLWPFFLSYWIIKRKWRWDIKLLLLAIIWIFLALVNFIEKENKTIPP